MALDDQRLKGNILHVFNTYFLKLIWRLQDLKASAVGMGYTVETVYGVIACTGNSSLVFK